MINFNIDETYIFSKDKKRNLFESSKMYDAGYAWIPIIDRKVI